jgi:hypothetical protein
VSRDWLRRDGRAFPVVGTTNMASDVHRKFLFEPNPHVCEMARRGVNFVRTGLWTAWARAMLDPGAADEGVLSALEAYVLSAARHGIEVCFTFFAFQPPAFGGSHPFLDAHLRAGRCAVDEPAGGRPPRAARVGGVAARAPRRRSRAAARPVGRRGRDALRPAAARGPGLGDDP